MATALLILLLFLSPLTGFGAERELCLACHPRHYGERGGCASCHRGNPASTRRNVAHQGLVAARHARFATTGNRLTEQGEALVQRLGCRRCHVILSRGNRLAASLDRIAATRSSAEMVASLKTPAVAMPDFRLDGERIDLLINTLYAAAGRGSSAGEMPLAVHFRNDGAHGGDRFSVKCGSCHRALSSGYGVVGGGGIGPDLSGLFSSHYSPASPGGERWTVRRLAIWLKNPRSIRPWTGMRPVAVTTGELEELAGILAVPPAGADAVGAMLSPLPVVSAPRSGPLRGMPDK